MVGESCQRVIHGFEMPAELVTSGLHLLQNVKAS